MSKNVLFVGNLENFEVGVGALSTSIYEKIKHLEIEYAENMNALSAMFDKKEDAVAAMVALQDPDTSNYKTKVVAALLKSLHDNELTRRDLSNLLKGINANKNAPSYVLSPAEIKKVGL